MALLPQDEAVNEDGWQVGVLPCTLSATCSIVAGGAAATGRSGERGWLAGEFALSVYWFQHSQCFACCCTYQLCCHPPSHPPPNACPLLYLQVQPPGFNVIHLPFSDDIRTPETDAGFAGTAVCCMQYCSFPVCVVRPFQCSRERRRVCRHRGALHNMKYCCCLCACVEPVQQQKQMPGLPAPRCVACCCPLPSIGGKTARHAQTADPAQHVRLPVAVSGGTGAAAWHACNRVAVAFSAVVWQGAAKLHPAVVHSCGLW